MMHTIYYNTTHTPPFLNLRALILFAVPKTSLTSNAALPINFIPARAWIAFPTTTPFAASAAAPLTTNTSTKKRSCVPYSYREAKVVVHFGFEDLRTT
jgi:hypothetical protein